MVERLDVDEEPTGLRHSSNASLGLEGIQIELQDFKDTAYPQPKDSVVDGELEGNFVMYGKVGSKEISRNLNVRPQQSS
jgi:hypothetical protein